MLGRRNVAVRSFSQGVRSSLFPDPAAISLQLLSQSKELGSNAKRFHDFTGLIVMHGARLGPLSDFKLPPADFSAAVYNKTIRLFWPHRLRSRRPNIGTRKPFIFFASFRWRKKEYSFLSLTFCENSRDEFRRFSAPGWRGERNSDALPGGEGLSVSGREITFLPTYSLISWRQTGRQERLASFVLLAMSGR